MNKTFKGTFVPFSIRLLKRLTPFFITFIFLYIQITFGKLSRGEMANYKSVWLVFFIVCLAIGLYHNINRLRTVVSEIRFDENCIQIIGQDYNSKFEDQLILEKVLIEIQEEELGKNKVRYCLEIYSEEKYYYLNKFNDWDYLMLAQIVDEYKARTGKHISGSEYYQNLVKRAKLKAA